MTLVSPFIHLRVHSAYSLAEGAIRISQLINLCLKNSMPAVALTDSGNLFGALEFSTACAAGGIQPIVGCTLPIKRPYQPAHSLNTPLDQLVLLVKDATGYLNLLELVSRSFIDADGAPCITLEMLKDSAEGLIALTGGDQGSLNYFLKHQQQDQALHYLQYLQECFKDRLYIELQRQGKEQNLKVEETLMSFAYDYSIPLVATNPAFFPDSSMFEAQDALLCIAEGSYITTEERRRLTSDHYFKSTEQMRQLFEDCPEAIANTAVIAKRCHFMPVPRKSIMPLFPVEKNRTEAEELKFQTTQGLRKRLELQVLKSEMTPQERQQLTHHYEQRLEYELSIIERMGFCGYFLIVSDFIKWARSQEIPVGPGRGSGAGSLVAWVLTITDIDPIRFNLIFERFLNPERVSMPDFDVDFCQNRRDEVITYVRDRYGKDQVAHIITFGKLQARAVLRDVGRVLQMPYIQVDKICKLVPQNPTHPVTLQQAIDQEPLLQQMMVEDSAVAKLIDIGLKLEGLYRHASTHAAGIVIADQPLHKLVPLYKDERSPLLVTQFSMKYAELAGLLKFDFLGLKTLTVLQDTVNLLKNRSINVNLSTIPLEDEKTFVSLRNVETVAVFQLESKGMSDVVRKLQPDKFEEIIAVVALYRPGPMDDIPRYIACKHGLEPVTYAHPLLEPILKDSFGVMVYQEQVMQIAQVLAGYNLGKADLLRRAMGKKIKQEMDDQRKQFVEGSLEKGVDNTTANHIFDQVAKFAGYGFNKSHAAPYALLSYQTAYLKANYPVEFFTALMSLDITNTDKLNIYQQEVRRLKILLLPPDINKSIAKFSIEKIAEEIYAIRYALAAVKNVGEGVIDLIVAEREKNGPFISIENFSSRLKNSQLNKRQLENLIAAGAFDSLCANRCTLYENIDILLKNRETDQDSLFGMANQTFTFLQTSQKEWGEAEKLNKEFQVLGFYLSAHPLQRYESLLEQEKFRSLSSFLGKNGQVEHFKMAGVLLAIQEKMSKQGNKFAFIKFSDVNGVYESIMFADTLTTLKQYNADLLQEGKLVLLEIQGRMEEEQWRLNILQLTDLEEVLLKNNAHYTITLNNEKELQELKPIIESLEKGKTRFTLLLGLPEGGTVSLILEDTYKLTGDDFCKIEKFFPISKAHKQNTHP